MNLVECVEMEVKVGLEWADAKAKADQLKELLGHVLDAEKNRIVADAMRGGQKKPAEDAISREARGADVYRDHVVAMVEAAREMNTLHVRYKAYERLFEAMRTAEVTNRKQDERSKEF